MKILFIIVYGIQNAFHHKTRVTIGRQQLRGRHEIEVYMVSNVVIDGR